MALDSSIYFQQQGVQLPDPVNKLAQLGQLQSFQNQNALAQLQLSQAQRANDQAEGLNRLYQNAVKADGTVDRSALFTGAAQQGLGSVIPGLQKQFAEADKATADVDESKAKTAKSRAETLNTTLQQGRDILTQANDPASARQWLAAQYANPDTAAIFNKLGPVDQALARFDQQTATPEGFARWKQGAMLTAQELVKQTMPDANTVLNAQVSRQNNADTNATSRANNAATNATTQRGQNMSYEAGKVPPGYRRTADGNLEAIPGGPADIKNSKEGNQRTQDAKDVLAIADQAEQLLGKASNGYLSSGYNQALGALGSSTAAAQADAQLKVLQGAMVSKMPKMSGPQSDKDVLLYREMAGQIGDPTVPVAQRRAALQTVRDLQRKYLGQDTAAPAAAAPAASSDGWSVTQVK